jgi:cell division protein FtsL
MSLKTNLSENLGGVRDAFGRARLSVVEIVFLGAAILYVGVVIFFYFYKVQPLGSDVAACEQQIKDLNAQILKLNTDEKKRVDQTTNAEKILQSLDQFDSLLKPDERGMTQIINEIDALGKSHKIYIGDASYRVERADEPQLDENGAPKPQAASKDKKLKIYPNLGIDTTVIGDYANLRRFISDLERSKQFLIVNALAFQGGDEKIMRQLTKGGKQIQGFLSGPESIPVSLRIELDTYFQPATARTTAEGRTTAADKSTAETPAAAAPNSKADSKNDVKTDSKKVDSKKAQALN